MAIREIPKGPELKIIEGGLRKTEAAIHELVDSPKTKGTILQRGKTLLGAIAIGALSAYGIDPSQAIYAITAPVEAMVGIMILPFVMPLVIALMVLRFLENVLVHCFDLLPSWFGARDSIQGVLRSSFRWLDPLESDVIAFTLEQVQHILAGYRIIILLVLGIDITSLLGVTGQPAGKKPAYATVAQVNHLQAELDYVRHHLGTVQYVTTNKQVTVGVPANVWDQIHHLESQMSAVTAALNAIDARLDHVSSTNSSQQHQIDRLSQGLHDIRAVSVGWQDIAQELERLGTRLTTEYNNTQQQVRSVDRRYRPLLALGLLTQPGLAGIKNLRKLEDNMCQCPKLPGIGNEMGTALAVLEFIENG